MIVFADVFLWLLAAATPLAAAAPFAFHAQHRTPGKITAALAVACWLSAGLAIAAGRLA